MIIKREMLKNLAKNELNMCFVFNVKLQQWTIKLYVKKT